MWNAKKIIATSLLACLGNVVGCQTTPFELEVEHRNGEFRFVLRYAPVEEHERYDLDGQDFVLIIHDGVTYRFYPALGIAVEVGTGRVYRLHIDDYRRLLDALGIDELRLYAQAGSSVSEESFEGLGTVHGISGIFDPLNQTMSTQLMLKGDVPIPDSDSLLWPSLEQELFIFPDGVKGSPDDLLLDVSGERDDVLRYLGELGVREATFKDGETEWFIQLDKEETIVDIYCNDILMFTINTD